MTTKEISDAGLLDRLRSGDRGRPERRGPAGASGSIEVKGLRKIFASNKGDAEVVAIDSIDLSIADGEFICLLGPSGCGKTTTLRCIAGLETADSGLIQIGSEVVFDSSTGKRMPTERRGLGMVFQSYAIWPHMTVAQNVGYPLRSGVAKGMFSKAEIAVRLETILDAVDCGRLGDRYPNELSGGQQQRVALARALVYEPRVLLFDEPLSNLDAKLRERMRFELRTIGSRIGFTGIYVTHDQEEALTLADRIAVMESGRIRQLGTPEEIYDTPADGFVADFIGAANVLPVERLTGDSRAKTRAGEFTFGHRSQKVLADDDLQLVVRPEHLMPAPEESESVNIIVGSVMARGFSGQGYLYTVEHQTGTSFRFTDYDRRRRFEPGEQVRLQADPGRVRLVPSGGFVPVELRPTTEV